MATTELLDKITHEQETLIFPHFSADDAFEIGIHLRQTARSLHGKIPVAIRITLATGQIIFTTLTTGPAVADSETWLKRKTNTVFRYGCASLYLGEKLRARGQKGDKVSEMAPVNDEEYACHGGAFPVRVRGVEGVVAVIVVSGLAQVEDHRLVVEGIKWFLNRSKEAT